ncbi:MAG TPA: HIT domain-containing protein [bacterium]|nr:HIT domain-containing protein [bacterium]
MADRPETDPDSRRILWAPWRISYIENCDRTTGCIFCEKPGEDKDRENLIVVRGETAFVIMNRYPYNNGHLMIVPYRHTSDPDSFSEMEKSECFDLLTASQQVLEQVMHPHGYNIGMNIGRVAGAGIADHLHYHLVPRWDGDTNFMPILGHAKVVSEGLEQTWEKLHKAFITFTTRQEKP